jgi:hypothetical protein
MRACGLIGGSLSSEPAGTITTSLSFTLGISWVNAARRFIRHDWIEHSRFQGGFRRSCRQGSAGTSWAQSRQYTDLAQIARRLVRGVDHRTVALPRESAAS